MSFFQKAPEFPISLSSDHHVYQCLDTYVDDEKEKEDIKSSLEKFYQDVINTAHPDSITAELNPPRHIPYAPFGQRIDEIEVSQAWQNLDAFSATHELIALGYNYPNASSNRLHQFLKLYLFHPSSAFYTCPLAMTDGAAKLTSIFKDDSSNPKTSKLLNEAFSHLTSTDPENFWTSGQWMTEKTGGSDISQSETVAQIDGDSYKLYGTKWFTSATTSQMTYTLARIKDENGNSISGSKGLSLFFLKLRNDDGQLDHIKVRRLKDKLGTKALPTAEIEFEGTTAHLVGEVGEGVKNISHLFNITRIYNATTTVGSFRRLLFLAHDYADKREAFGKKLKDQPLHKRLLKEADQAFDRCFKLTFFTVSLLQRYENDPSDTQASTLLRLFTPLAKLYTAKTNMIWTSELIESFGGAGYIEDTHLPRFLRDSQVLCIWEGTTNVLSLDCLRAIQKENALEAYFSFLGGANPSDPELFESKLRSLKELIKKLGTDTEAWQYHARDLAFDLVETYLAST